VKSDLAGAKQFHPVNYFNMATIHKCDKCRKAIKGEEISLTFSDMTKRFFEKGFNNYDFCEACAGPVAVFVKKFLNNKNKK